MMQEESVLHREERKMMDTRREEQLVQKKTH